MKTCVATPPGMPFPNMSSMVPVVAEKFRLIPTTWWPRRPDSLVLRNYKGDIYEYPEVAAPANKDHVPTPVYRHLEFFDPVEEREEITSRSWRPGRRD